MACEQNIQEVTVTPSLAAPTDMILVTLPDGTSFLRPWSQFVQSVPDDVDITVVESGGDVNNGDEEVVIAAHVGWRARVFRNGVPESTNTNRETYYSYDINTGTYLFTPALSTGEFLQFQAY